MKIKDEGHFHFSGRRRAFRSRGGIRNPYMALKYGVYERKGQTEDTEVL